MPRSQPQDESKTCPHFRADANAGDHCHLTGTATEEVDCRADAEECLPRTALRYARGERTVLAKFDQTTREAVMTTAKTIRDRGSGIGDQGSVGQELAPATYDLTDPRALESFDADQVETMMAALKERQQALRRGARQAPRLDKRLAALSSRRDALDRQIEELAAQRDALAAGIILPKSWKAQRRGVPRKTRTEAQKARMREGIAKARAAKAARREAEQGIKREEKR